MKEDLLKSISLYELYLLIVLIILASTTQNTYLLLLFIALFSKHIPEQIIKRFLSYDKQGNITNIAKRPEGAFNCNMFNSGGDASTTSGLISGHVFLISTLTFYTIFKFTNSLKNKPTLKQSILITILITLTLTVAYARINIKCHTKTQALLGFVAGIIWGYIIYIITKNIIKKYKRLQEDQNKIDNLFQ